MNRNRIKIVELKYHCTKHQVQLCIILFDLTQIPVI